MKINKICLTLASLLTFSLTACTKKTDSATSPTSNSNRVVNLAIWGNYITPEIQKKFETETGIKIRISNYSSNEELLAKVQAGAGGIDLAVPSDYMVEIMIKAGLLSPIDKSKITNMINLSPEWMGRTHDPENKYSLPYSWTTTGIAVVKDLAKSDVKSWKDFFTNPNLAGKISMLDDVREATGAALKMNGFSLNTKSADELKKAEAALTQMKPRLKMFKSDMVDALVNKEIAAGMAYSSDALQAIAKKPGQIEFFLPEEGGSVALDSLVILKNAKNLQEAHELMNFMLSPEVNVAFVSHIRAGPVLKTTKDKLPDDLKNNSALFPNPLQLKKLEGIRDLGETTTAYDALWTKIKSM
ncbi:MAG: spermidine/putrescine ABC transporter substrate-binding protein [Oligoflexia bacterium]|nr:MAG: spermidine/putrescine ABC transporter substrate-binding protein [Oligoflexia bacterium]